MIYLVFFLALWAWWACRLHVHKLEAAKQKASLSFVVLSTCNDFLLPLWLVALFYSALSLALSLVDLDAVSAARLRRLDELILTLDRWVKAVRLTPGVSVLLLLAFFVATLAARYGLLRRSRYVESSYKLFDVFQKWTKTLSVAVALLSSFTLLGGQAREHRGPIVAQLKRLQDEYRAFERSVAKAAEHELIRQVTEHVFANPTLELLPIVERAKVLETQLADLAARSRKVGEMYADTGFAAEEGERRERAAEKRAAEAKRNLESTQSESLVVEMTMPEGLSSRDLAERREQCEAALKESDAKLTTMLEMPVGKKLVVGLLGMLVAVNRPEFVSGLGQEFAIQQPLLKVVDSLLSQIGAETMRNAIRRTIDRSVAGKNVQAVVVAEVGSVVQPVTARPIETDPQDVARAEAAMAIEESAFRTDSDRFEQALAEGRRQAQARNAVLAEDLKTTWRRVVSVEQDARLQAASRPRRLRLPREHLRIPDSSLADAFIADAMNLQEPDATRRALETAIRRVGSVHEIDERIPDFLRKNGPSGDSILAAALLSQTAIECCRPKNGVTSAREGTAPDETRWERLQSEITAHEARRAEASAREARGREFGNERYGRDFSGREAYRAPTYRSRPMPRR